MRSSRSLVARLPTVEKWFWFEFATEAGLCVLYVLFLKLSWWNTWLQYNKLFQISSYHISSIMGLVKV